MIMSLEQKLKVMVSAIKQPVNKGKQAFFPYNMPRDTKKDEEIYGCNNRQQVKQDNTQLSNKKLTDGY